MLKVSVLLYVQIEAYMVRGHTLEGLRCLLHLVLLQDPAMLRAGPLMPSALVPLEDLMTRTPTSETDLLLSTLPNLLRMINSGAAIIQGMAGCHDSICTLALSAF